MEGKREGGSESVREKAWVVVDMWVCFAVRRWSSRRSQERALEQLGSWHGPAPNASGASVVKG